MKKLLKKHYLILALPHKCETKLQESYFLLQLISKKRDVILESAKILNAYTEKWNSHDFYRKRKYFLISCINLLMNVC